MDQPTGAEEKDDLPAWLVRIEMLGTTAVVLLISSMVLWLESSHREPRLLVAIGAGLLAYVVALVAFARRSGTTRIPWWPFALAGFLAGALAELINAQLLLTREFGVAGFTGALIGTAQWTALRSWIRLAGRSD